MLDIQLVPVVVGCVLEKDNKYLLVQEKRPKVSGLWNLPAGHVDTGETLEAAAIREVYEETGYEIELKGEVNVEHSDIEKPVLHAYAGNIKKGELRFPPNELLDAKWFSLDEIHSLRQSGKLRNEWVFNSIQKYISITKFSS
jgi:8-oxo-dGTP diphosphatase